MPEQAPIDPKNTSALINHRGRGNPLAASPSTAISNCFPGLEFDFRAAWKRILVGVELHEARNRVESVEPGSPAAAAGISEGDTVESIDGQTIAITAQGPRIPGGPTTDLRTGNLEWGNAISSIVPKANQTVDCVFNTSGGQVTVALTVREILDGVGIAEDAAEPGVLTQGLCSPWQNDYRECGCYYWASSRPDYVNVEIDGGNAAGHNWLLKNRTATTPKNYRLPGQLTYEELFMAWESELRFVRRGQDSE